MEFIFLFYTHSGAIKFQRKCNKNRITCELMPVPRVLSSNCSISAKIKTDRQVEKFIDKEVEKVFSYKNKEYKLIYQAK